MDLPTALEESDARKVRALIEARANIRYKTPDAFVNLAGCLTSPPRRNHQAVTP